MNLLKFFFICMYFFFLSSCADYSMNKTFNKDKINKRYYSSKGFALIYEDSLFVNKIINKKLNNENEHVIHNSLKIGTIVKINNPDNSKTIIAKVYKKSTFPKIFNLVISKKISDFLELDPNNPYIEFNEIKKNKTFVAKKSNTFDEEKNVAGKAPIDDIKVDDLSKKNTKSNKNKALDKNFFLIINDFYYENSAKNLKNDLIKKTNFKNIYIKKINNNKYRLFSGPFKNFKALKTSYISLNKLGFENLNIYKQ